MDEQIEPVDRWYRDPYGKQVHVVGFDRKNQRVIFKIENYEHECVQPLWQFRTKFKRIDNNE
ncbi:MULTISPECIES: DUF4222 domain-containing protein [Lonsdalea]|uniref:Uncharacterized protein n=2 Tax=Lonsdalea TaxID=1082702 RepID=A0ACD1JGR8_9GAMM|nr:MULTISPECIES: DUF4222 domain-containing protein [Lonsdalea]RAT16205.1 hypothetical protein AU485_01975 [Lonsdalea quercina]RAT23877.1 hypothetical protein AU487_00580 [Lonsdalea populi]RAT25454.1 hypothetical protein AU489_07075 [Lonsdalea populi]RAT28490.1 hypothetical protein AU488_00485 [Lonsdalea populi]RAT38296.1 hypothetical protein AU492_00525 [Lonsdalea populi]